MLFRSKQILTSPASSQAQALNGSYSGFQPKPAVEVIIVAMKPLSEKTYVNQALKNKRGITWLDDGRIPYESEDLENRKKRDGDSFRVGKYDLKVFGQKIGNTPNTSAQTNHGRFPANLLVSDDVLNDGINRKGGGNIKNRPIRFMVGSRDWGTHSIDGFNDSGSFSRYFDLDKWFEKKLKELPASVQKTFPFLIVPKASKGEKNKNLDSPKKETPFLPSGAFETNNGEKKHTLMRNYHPTCKPLKLMSYLITLGSREGDIVLDPFLGSGTTALACQLLGRECIGIEINLDYYEIAQRRLQLKQKTWYKE